MRGYFSNSNQSLSKVNAKLKAAIFDSSLQSSIAHCNRPRSTTSFNLFHLIASADLQNKRNEKL